MTDTRPEPDIFATATLVNGLPTVTFASRPYPRAIRTVFMNANKAGATGTIYRGLISEGGQIAQIGNANPNTYNVPFLLPAGQTLWVVFSLIASPVNAALARISSSRDW